MEKFLENYQLSGTELKIVTYPDPVLATPASTVESHEFNDDLKKLCLDMLYTMYHAPGIGLAAPQIGISKRIFVIDVEYTRNTDEDEADNITGKTSLDNFNPLIFINPVIKEKIGDTCYQEGCLSLPGVFEEVKRAKSIVIEYQDTSGAHHQMEATDLLAICIQHENDHLDGIVFIDRLSNLKKNFFKKKLIKEKRR